MEKLKVMKKLWIITGLNSFIELPEQEVQAKTGVFQNPATGALWKLFIREGKLLVEVPNFSFQISPLSHRRFRPVNTQVNLEFEFEEPCQNKPLLLHIYAKGINRATFEAL
jgi:hypothetical protein